MSKQDLDYSKLLGFDAVKFDRALDFKDETIGARLGAKVGEILGTSRIAFEKLLGFDALSNGVEVDFKDETVAARVGAKVGEPPVAPESKPQV